MKRTLSLLLIAVLILSLTACDNFGPGGSIAEDPNGPNGPYEEVTPTETPGPTTNTLDDPDGFHYVRSLFGDYLWLGMPRGEVEQIVGFDRFSDDVYVSIFQAIHVGFDENNRVRSIFVPFYSLGWSARGDIGVESPTSELAAYFDGIYAMFDDSIMMLFFASDHTPVQSTDEAAYRLMFTLHNEEVTGIHLSVLG